nr:manganese efflux pump MntP family protein [uncultured Romboutsia sp.]
MNFIALIFTAFALSMDAFAVSITKGMTIKNLKKSTALKMALTFGVFQGAMPLLGWALGISFESYIKSIDHWIAFILLGFIGFNMIKGFFDDRKEGRESELEFSATADEHDLSNKEIIMLAVATSIDALAVGISFAFLNVSIIPAASIICIITFLVCVVGVFVGNKVGDIFNGYAELVGGIILILIGFNIFNEHTQILSKIFNSLF